MPTTHKTLHVRIQARNEEALRELPISQMDRGCMGGVQTLPDGSMVLEAFVQEAVLKKIKDRRVKVQVLADVAEEGKKKQKQVGRGNRFTGENWIPRGLGKKVRDGGK